MEMVLVNWCNCMIHAISNRAKNFKAKKRLKVGNFVAVSAFLLCLFEHIPMIFWFVIRNLIVLFIEKEQIK